MENFCGHPTVEHCAGAVQSERASPATRVIDRDKSRNRSQCCKQFRGEVIYRTVLELKRRVDRVLTIPQPDAQERPLPTSLSSNIRTDAQQLIDSSGCWPSE